MKCHFCKKEGHFNKDCHKRKEWFEKKGMNIYVIFESNLTEVPSNTWWIDSGATVHVSNTMQGFLTTRTILPNERYIMMGNRAKVPVKAVGTFRLVLDSGFNLDLFHSLYVPSISRNLISLSRLDVDGYTFSIGNKCFSLFKNLSIVGSGTLCDGLYKLKLNNHFAETLMILHPKVRTKRSLITEMSSFLWHKRLGHIFKERIQRLVKDGILENIDFTDLGVYVDCIKGKQTKHTKKGATRSTNLLEIIHTDICRPFTTSCFGGEKYFITFIDDFSRYGYIYLLNEKSQSMDAFEVYITEVERQLDRKVKL